MSADKRAIRQELRKLRQRLPAPLVEAAGVAVCARLLGCRFYQAAAAVAVYVADENEIPTVPLVAEARSAGRRLYLPRVAGLVSRLTDNRQPTQARVDVGTGAVVSPSVICCPGDPETAPEWAPSLVRWESGSPLRRAAGGVQEPLDGAPALLELPAVLLLPVVAWDVTGTRLGRGGGFYDRLLAGLDPRIVRVGLAYEFQEFPELPRDSWDLSMHYVITERRLVACGDSRDASLQKGELQV